MQKVEQIEQEIQQLSPTEFAELRDWLLARDWKAWDAQIEEDSRSGRLDDLLAEAREDYRSGRARKI